MKNKLVKGLTLFCFIGLILIFIAYRSNNIEDIPVMSDSDFAHLTYPDSILIKDSFEINELMSSSKSITIVPTKTKIKDTLPAQTIDVVNDSALERQRFLIMSSSKSAIIFDKPFSTDIKPYLNDSLKKLYNP